jgi:hypothetical protein
MYTRALGDTTDEHGKMWGTGKKYVELCHSYKEGLKKL